VWSCEGDFRELVEAPSDASDRRRFLLQALATLKGKWIKVIPGLVCGEGGDRFTSRYFVEPGERVKLLTYPPDMEWGPWDRQGSVTLKCDSFSDLVLETGAVNFLCSTANPFRSKAERLWPLSTEQPEPEEPFESIQEAEESREAQLCRSFFKTYEGHRLKVAGPQPLEIYPVYARGHFEDDVLPGEEVLVLPNKLRRGASGLIWCRVDPNPDNPELDSMAEVTILELAAKTETPFRATFQRLWKMGMGGYNEPEEPLGESESGAHARFLEGALLSLAGRNLEVLEPFVVYSYSPSEFRNTAVGLLPEGTRVWLSKKRSDASRNHAFFTWRRGSDTGEAWSDLDNFLLHTKSPFRAKAQRLLDPESVPNEPEEPLEEARSSQWGTFAAKAAQSLFGRDLEVDYSPILKGWQDYRLGEFVRAEGFLPGWGNMYLDAWTWGDPYQSKTHVEISVTALILSTKNIFRSRLRDLLQDDISLPEPEFPLESIQEDEADDRYHDFVGRALRSLQGKWLKVVSHEILLQPGTLWRDGYDFRLVRGERIQILEILDKGSSWLATFQIEDGGQILGPFFGSALLRATENPFRERLRKLDDISFPEPEEPFESIRESEARLQSQDFEGEPGNPDHLTRRSTGTVPTGWLAGLEGARGEQPGQHGARRLQGSEWDRFVADVREHGILEPILILVDPDEEPKIAEGNTRRDAAVELGLPQVPVEIRYFGHAERAGQLESSIFPERLGFRDLVEWGTKRVTPELLHSKAIEAAVKLKGKKLGVDLIRGTAQWWGGFRSLAAVQIIEAPWWGPVKVRAWSKPSFFDRGIFDADPVSLILCTKNRYREDLLYWIRSAEWRNKKTRTYPDPYVPAPEHEPIQPPERQPRSQEPEEPFE